MNDSTEFRLSAQPTARGQPKGRGSGCRFPSRQARSKDPACGGPCAPGRAFRRCRPARGDSVALGGGAGFFGRADARRARGAGHACCGALERHGASGHRGAGGSDPTKRRRAAADPAGPAGAGGGAGPNGGPRRSGCGSVGHAAFARARRELRGVLDNDDPNVGPPDTQGAVGPNHLMVTLNSQVRIQDRSGRALSTVTLSDFWRASAAATSTRVRPARSLRPLCRALDHDRALVDAHPECLLRGSPGGCVSDRESDRELESLQGRSRPVECGFSRRWASTKIGSS